MPVRARTLAPRGVLHGIPDSMHATCTGNSAELTRARTAMSEGSTPEPCQAVMISTAKAASASPGAVRTATGPAPANGPGMSMTTSLRPSGGRMVGGSGEVAREVDEELGRRPRIAIDDLVVIADGEAVIARGGEQPDQQQMGGGEVLEFVDEQATTPGLRRSAGTGIGHQDLDGTVDLLVEVDRPEVRQGGTVTIESLGDARRIGHRLLDGLRRVEPEPDGGQGADIGGDRVGVRLAPNVEQSLQEIAHAELLEHSRTTRRSELGADPQAGAVEGSDVRPFGREYPGAPLLHLIGRPGVVGQGTHGARRGSTVGDEMKQRCSG